MKVIVDFCLIVLRADIEGEWESVMDAIKRCHVQVHEMGAPRINSTISG